MELGQRKITLVLDRLSGTLTSMGLGCLAEVTQKVLWNAWARLLADRSRKSRPIMGTATFMTLDLRKSLALTMLCAIRLATIITGTELTQVAVTLAIAPAVLGLEAIRIMFIPLAVCVQLLVTRAVFRLRWVSMRRTRPSLQRVLQTPTVRLLGQLKTALMFLVLREVTTVRVLATAPFLRGARSLGLNGPFLTVSPCTVTPLLSAATRGTFFRSYRQ